MIGNALDWVSAAFLVFAIACINAVVAITQSLLLLIIVLGLAMAFVWLVIKVAGERRKRWTK